MRIDAHQHFWNYSATEYSWIGAGMERLAGDYMPADLAAVATGQGVAGSVAVQARQSLEETRWLLGLADESPFIKGVVGWVDLRCGRVAGEIAAFAQHEKFVGVRHVVQDEPDPRFLLGDAFVRGLRQLHAFELVYDLLLYPPQLPAAVELAGLLPEQQFVLDHLAKPRIKTGIKTGEIAEWRRDIEALAAHKNVACKLSGLVTEAAWRQWKRDDFTPCLDVALAAFGPERLMFGSDWPVCLLSGEYEEVVEIVDVFISTLTLAEQSMIWGETASRVYGLT
ncbi:amidohydrolase [bacterium]|nr:amidohydrolase [bacterium]